MAQTRQGMPSVSLLLSLSVCLVDVLEEILGEDAVLLHSGVMLSLPGSHVQVRRF